MAPRILQFSQGIVEIGLRVATAVFGFAALIAGVSAVAVAENDLKSINDTLYLYKGTLGAGAVINTFGTIAVVSQLAMVVLRLLNRCNININFFLTVNIFLSVFLVVGYLSGGAYAAHVAVGWNHIHDDSHAGGIETVVGSLAAGAALCFLSLIVCVILAVWMALFMMKNWNEYLEDNTHRRVLLAGERQYFN